MTPLIERMREELVRRNFSPMTIRSYLHAVAVFQQYLGKPLEEAGPDDIRHHQVYLLEDRKLAKGTVVIHVSALRFLYVRVLKRREMKEDLPYPKCRKRLPVVLSREEVGHLIDSAKNLFYRALLMTLYGTGVRRSELRRLKVGNIDSQRMMLRVEHGKGGIDRDIPLNPQLLETLREYWRMDAAQDLPVPRHGQRLARRQTHYCKSDLGGCAWGGPQSWYPQARQSPHAEPFLRDASLGGRRGPKNHPGSARSRRSLTHHRLFAPVAKTSSSRTESSGADSGLRYGPSQTVPKVT